MEPNVAEENLQVIRTLMERSALYRRALAPVMLTAGVLGLTGWFVGNTFHLDTRLEFDGLWFSIAAIAIGTSLLIARRQALSSAESFWTPPTRRVVQAMAAPLAAGLLAALVPFFVGLKDADPGLERLWPLLYGCALHSAGLFVSRGVRLLGWGFILFSVAIAIMRLNSPMGIDAGSRPAIWFQPHAVMGLTFGGLHLLAGIYLYFTEKGRNAQ